MTTFIQIIIEALNNNIGITYSIIGTLVSAFIAIRKIRNTRISNFKSAFDKFIIELERKSEISINTPISIGIEFIDTELVKQEVAILNFMGYLKGGSFNLFNTKTTEYKNKITEYKNISPENYKFNNTLMCSILDGDIKIKKELRSLIKEIFEIVDKH